MPPKKGMIMKAQDLETWKLARENHAQIKAQIKSDRKRGELDGSNPCPRQVVEVWTSRALVWRTGCAEGWPTDWLTG